MTQVYREFLVYIFPFLLNVYLLSYWSSRTSFTSLNNNQPNFQISTYIIAKLPIPTSYTCKYYFSLAVVFRTLLLFTKRERNFGRSIVQSQQLPLFLLITAPRHRAFFISFALFSPRDVYFETCCKQTIHFNTVLMTAHRLFIWPFCKQPGKGPEPNDAFWIFKISVLLPELREYTRLCAKEWIDFN